MYFFLFFKASRAIHLPSSDYFCLAFVSALAYFVMFSPVLLTLVFGEHSISFEKKFHNGAFYYVFVW